MMQLLHTDNDPGVNDDLLIFSRSSFDVSNYIAQFHPDYIRDQHDGLNFKLDSRRHQVDIRLKELTNEHFIAFLRITEDYRHRGIPLRSKLFLNKYQFCLQSLMACSFSDLPLGKLQESPADTISDNELHSIQNLIDNGQLDLAVNSIVTTRQLTLSPTQQQMLNRSIECLTSVLLFGIHKQTMLCQSKSKNLVSDGFPDLTSSVSLLVKLEKKSQALSAFFEFHAFIQDRIVSSILEVDADGTTCALNAISSCTEAILSALQQYQQIFAEHFSLSKFAAWATSQMSTVSAIIAELLSHCNTDELSKAESDLQHHLKLLTNAGFNFWFLFEKSLSKIHTKKDTKRTRQ